MSEDLDPAERMRFIKERIAAVLAGDEPNRGPDGQDMYLHWIREEARLIAEANRNRE
jgi:hypothetical protein